MKKVLYAIQGTGNGHVARAREVIPILQKYCDLDVLLAGNQSEVALPVTPKFQLRGLTFDYSNNGGIDYWKTLLTNNPFRWLNEVRTLPVEEYDLVINDFEGVSAYAARRKGVPTVSLSHQCSLLTPLAPRPEKKSMIGEWILKYYAPTDEKIGFNFFSYDEFVHPPVIRKEVRELEFEDLGHITVYLPAYSDATLGEIFGNYPKHSFQVFSKTAKEITTRNNCIFFPASSETYVESFRSCSGLLTGAGFEAPSEALFAGKKLAVIPIGGQYEQKCNAASLKMLGVPVFDKLQADTPLKNWLESEGGRQMDFPDTTEEIIAKLLL